MDAPAKGPLRLRQDALAGLLLFAATAAVVTWQNSRLAVLWDLSYILETACRISLGHVPYRDFPLPFPPWTFLTQAALIKLGGRVYFHHVVYCAMAGGAATVLAWRILLLLLRGQVHRPRRTAFLLSGPLVVLGIYSIFPHPFYDCDCTFAILVCFWLLLEVESRSFPAAASFLAGMASVLPALVKQNTGLAFLGSAAVAVAALMVFTSQHAGPERDRELRGYGLILGGMGAGLAVAALAIQFTFGLNNYAHWTFQYAAARRMPSLADMLAMYQDRKLLWWLPAVAAGAGLLSMSRRNRWAGVAGGILTSLPFAWTALCLLAGGDASEKAEYLLALWPLALMVSFIAAVAALWPKVHRGALSLRAALPFIVIATVHGALLSQQVWGSSYALWPLLMVLLASAIAALAQWSKPAAWLEVMLPAVIAASLFISGAHHAWSHERLDYAKVSEGEPRRKSRARTGW